MDRQADGIPVVNDQSENEPETTEVVGQSATNNTAEAGPASVQGAGPRLGVMDHAAIQAQYRQFVAKTMRDFDECIGNGPSGP